MAALLLRRLLQYVPTILLVIFFSWGLMRLAPGGPYDSERRLDPDIERQIRHHLGLDLPWYRQFAAYLEGVLRGDLGMSTEKKDESVNAIVAQTMPVSIVLGGLALLLATTAGVLAGVLAAVRKNGPLDHATMGVSMVGISVPDFVVGPLLIILFAITLRWLPIGGWWLPGDGPGGSDIGSWKNLVLPAVTLALPYVAYITRLTRAGMLEVLVQDHIRTARAKGLPGRTVVMRHALKGGILPVVSFLGPAAAAIVTGSVVVEQIFNIPGAGKPFVQGALNRDYTMVLGLVIVYATMLMAFNLLVDLAYGWLDPRGREDG